MQATPSRGGERAALGVYFLLVCTELVYGLLDINFTWLELCAGEVSTVGRVGEVLCLKAKT